MRSETPRKPSWERPSLFTRVMAAAGLVFLHAPVWVIALYAFTTEDRTYQFPPPGLTLLTRPPMIHGSYDDPIFNY